VPEIRPPARVQIDPSKIKVLLLPVLDEPAERGRRSPLREQIVRLSKPIPVIAAFHGAGRGDGVQAAQGFLIENRHRRGDRSTEVLDGWRARGCRLGLSVIVEEVDYDKSSRSNGTHFSAHTRCRSGCAMRAPTLWLPTAPTPSRQRRRSAT